MNAHDFNARVKVREGDAATLVHAPARAFYAIEFYEAQPRRDGSHRRVKVQGPLSAREADTICRAVLPATLLSFDGAVCAILRDLRTQTARRVMWGPGDVPEITEGHVEYLAYLQRVFGVAS